MTYQHLTETDRIQLNALLQVGVKIPTIAVKIGRNKCTIYRELDRNSFNGEYFSTTAQLKSEERRTLASKDRDELSQKDLELIEKALTHGLSPEQINGRQKLEKVKAVSISKIYKIVKEDKLTGGTLWSFLRRSGKTYRKPYGSNGGNESGIKNRISIENRPKIVEIRKRTGDIEADTMIGARHQGVILTMNDRRTKKVSIDKLESKQSTHVKEVMVNAIKKFPGTIHTCTVDNGKEFASHEDFTKETGAVVYFCHTMSPHERGSNENMNGLIRQFLPKGTNLKEVTQERLTQIEYLLNSRPRKTLNFLTPLEKEVGEKPKFNFFVA